VTALWLLGRVPQDVLPWPLLRAGRAGRGPGPDVREAVFIRDGVPVAGDVEVRLRASDFRRHGHESDPVYAGVLLHLVWEDDLGQRYRWPGAAAPCAGLAASRPTEETRELVRAEGQRRLAERVWRAARLAERAGWDGAWCALRDRAAVECRAWRTAKSRYGHRRGPRPRPAG
jgi:hypothetical protein